MCKILHIIRGGDPPLFGNVQNVLSVDPYDFLHTSERGPPPLKSFQKIISQGGPSQYSCHEGDDFYLIFFYNESPPRLKKNVFTIYPTPRTPSSLALDKLHVTPGVLRTLSVLARWLRLTDTILTDLGTAE